MELITYISFLFLMLKSEKRTLIAESSGNESLKRCPPIIERGVISKYILLK